MIFQQINPFLQSFPESTEEYVGSKIILGCRAGGEPHSEIIWKKQDQDIALDQKRIFQTREGTLVILDVMLTDAGVYSCTARNKLGMITKEVTVDVEKGVQVLTITTVFVQNYVHHD